jgi:hypothetical protein
LPVRLQNCDRLGESVPLSIARHLTIANQTLVECVPKAASGCKTLVNLAAHSMSTVRHCEKQASRFARA